MTTDESVEHIDWIIQQTLKDLRNFPLDKMASDHIFKTEQAWLIIKQDLKNGFKHYIGDSL